MNVGNELLWQHLFVRCSTPRESPLWHHRAQGRFSASMHPPRFFVRAAEREMRGVGPCCYSLVIAWKKALIGSQCARLLLQISSGQGGPRLSPPVCATGCWVWFSLFLTGVEIRALATDSPRPAGVTTRFAARGRGVNSSSTAESRSSPCMMLLAFRASLGIEESNE